jgi:hypothetical protein
MVYLKLINTSFIPILGADEQIKNQLGNSIESEKGFWDQTAIS